MGEKPEYLEATPQLDCQHSFSLQKERTSVKSASASYKCAYITQKSPPKDSLLISMLFLFIRTSNSCHIGQQDDITKNGKLFMMIRFHIFLKVINIFKVQILIFNYLQIFAMSFW